MFASIIRSTMGAALLFCFGHLSGAAFADGPKLKASGVIPMTLVGASSDVDRAKILRAINEWNFALSRDQKCVDYPAMARVAARHRPALPELKGCGEAR